MSLDGGDVVAVEIGEIAFVGRDEFVAGHFGHVGRGPLACCEES